MTMIYDYQALLLVSAAPGKGRRFLLQLHSFGAVGIIFNDIETEAKVIDFIEICGVQFLKQKMRMRKGCDKLMTPL